MTQVIYFKQKVIGVINARTNLWCGVAVKLWSHLVYNEWSNLVRSNAALGRLVQGQLPLRRHCHDTFDLTPNGKVRDIDVVEVDILQVDHSTVNLAEESMFGKSTSRVLTFWPDPVHTGGSQHFLKARIAFVFLGSRTSTKSR